MVGLLLGVLVGQVSTGGERQIDFQKDVAPILQQQCLDCHGPALQMAELRLDQRKFVLADDGRGLVKPGKSSESLLVHRLTDRKLGILMPPTFPFFPGEKAGLAEEKIKVLQAWIDQGAQWPEGVTLASETASAENAKVRALFVAIRSGRHQAVRDLLDKDKDLASARAADGSTPLMQAAAYADAQLMQLLLDRGPDVNAKNRDGATALMRAAGDLEKVKLLLARGADLQAKSALGRTALLIAATYPGNPATVKLLLDRGANIKDVDSYGETCLTSACKRGDAEMAKLLLAAGADPIAGGRPPLVWAAEEGNLATIACLLEHGTPQPPPVISAALSSAAARGPAEAVKLLLARGADPNAPSRIAGYTPLMWASYSDYQSDNAVKLLLDKGADRGGKGADGQTPLSLARKFGATPIVALLEQGRAGEPAPEAAAGDGAQLPELRAAIDKSLKLLQECGPKFFNQSGCIACHQQSVTSLAVAAARRKGVKVDEQTAREQVAMTALTAKTYIERFLQRADHPAGSAPSGGYISLGLAAEKYPADEITDATIFE
ncbi:MAG TPA: ankyrin repeat domain-containing protein, partial [Pirellulaceae bacterium]|nr:ankyrin repeat domain-containing protein [Pirellulaceae bacterium]